MLRIVRDGVFAGLLLAVACCQAGAGEHGYWNTINRKLGLGWSDGYHAHNGCEGQSEWTSVHPVPPAPTMRELPQPTPAVSTRRQPTPAVRASQLPQKGPTLPSQKFSPKPAYWYR